MTEKVTDPTTIEQERDRYRAALESLRAMQGEIVPVINQEMVPVDWVLAIVNSALGEGSVSIS